MRWLARLLRRWGGEYFMAAANKRRAAAGDPEALQALAQDALKFSDFAAARQLIDQAILLAPDSASLRVTQAAILRRDDALDEARAVLDAALALAPNHPGALTNLAELELVQGYPERAMRLLDRVEALAPDLLPARINRVAALSEVGAHETAWKLGEGLLKRHPDVPELLLNTANALLQLARGRKALEYLRRALVLRPDFPEATYLLATLVGDTAATAPALAYLERRLAAQGETLGLLMALATGHQAAGHLARARELAQRILAREPEHVGARLVLASCLSSCGHAEAADRFYAALYQQADDLAGMASNWLFEGNYLPHLPPEELFSRHRRWAERYETSPPALETLTPASGASEVPRPLRVGYVSGDFCAHPVGYLLLQILRMHDRAQVMPIAFSTTLREDHLTRELKPGFEQWHDVFDLDDEELLALIRRERIDVLVDLAGHTGFHKLKVFARRAAPVQISWIGYFHSTGLTRMDYVITDPDTSPAALGQHFSEVPLYVGPTRFCMFPPSYAPDVAVAPHLRGNPFTFGCFNRLAKLNDDVIDAWAEILRRAPQTRLWLKAGSLGDPWVRSDLTERFRAAGVDAARLVLSGSSGHGQMLTEFEMVDLCLDPFPFTGGATSLESLWMGVPTLTVPGTTMVSRQTHSMNANLGLVDEFSASGVRDYIERAVAFSRCPHSLFALRPQLRERVARSPLCDGAEFTRRLETLYAEARKSALAGRRLAPYTSFTLPAGNAEMPANQGDTRVTAES